MDFGLRVQGTYFFRQLQEQTQQSLEEILRIQNHTKPIRQMRSALCCVQYHKLGILHVKL